MARRLLRKVEMLVVRVLVARAEGQTNVEYSLVLLLIGVATAAGFKLLGSILQETLLALTFVFP